MRMLVGQSVSLLLVEGLGDGGRFWEWEIWSFIWRAVVNLGCSRLSGRGRAGGVILDMARRRICLGLWISHRIMGVAQSYGILAWIYLSCV